MENENCRQDKALDMEAGGEAMAQSGEKKKLDLYSALHSVGVFSHYRGYRYFVMAVRMAAEKPERMQSIGKEIYMPIAKECGTSPSNVEKDIRTVRDVMMRNGGAKLLAEAAGYPFWGDKPPYPNEIIGVFASYFFENKIDKEAS